MRLLVIFGPPAVGKMTVGRAVAARSGFRLFHNHATIEPLLEVFDFGTPPFLRLLGEWRRRVVEEAVASGTDLVLTYVWDLEDEADAEEMRGQIGLYVEAGAEVAFVELAADLDTRLERNRTEHRLAEKRSKRDLAWSEGNVREMERYVMNTDPDAATPASAVLDEHRHLHVDNTALTPEQAAEQILEWLDEDPATAGAAELPRGARRSPGA
jgi:hypothetical protein